MRLDIPFDTPEKSALFDVKVLWEGFGKMGAIESALNATIYNFRSWEQGQVYFFSIHEPMPVLTDIQILSPLKHSLTMKIATTFMALATVAILSSCGSKTTETTDTTEFADSTNEATAETTGSDSASTAMEDDAEFAVEAANGGLAEVALSKIAVEKATDPKVKEFAKQMITDHSKANEELKTLATSKNITLPTAPNEEKQKAASDLGSKSGSDFDEAYIEQMDKDHRQTVKLFEDAQKEVKDAEMKAFIDKTLPVIKAHAEHVKSLNKTK